MVEAYTSFAKVYDTLMDDVPYQEWADYVEKLLRSYQITEGLLLDLGCGTGNLTERFAEKRYDMIGIDNAEDMLQIALEKKETSNHDILYLLQDMREFELFGTVRAVISICDSINYILEENDLLNVFRLVNNYLDPKGIFIFDLNTIYKYQQILGKHTFAENRDRCSFIWDNYYDEEEQINEYSLTLFVKEDQISYHKYEETHFQRAYDIATIRKLLEEAGLEFLAVYDAFTFHAPNEKSERVYFVAREKGK